MLIAGGLRYHRGLPRGFTLVELLVTLALVAIMASLAAPSLAQMIGNYRVRSAAGAMVEAMQYARAEAMRRNTSVRFTLTSGGPGWEVSQVSPAQTLTSQPASESEGVQVASVGSATTLTFARTGLLDTGTHITQLTLTGSLPGVESRRINVHGSALIRMCDPAVTTTNDPRRC